VKIKIGKIHEQYITLPKFMISVYLRHECYQKRFLRIGRLYRGYVGIYGFWGRLHFDLWIHNMQKEA